MTSKTIKNIEKCLGQFPEVKLEPAEAHVDKIDPTYSGILNYLILSEAITIKLFDNMTAQLKEEKVITNLLNNDIQHLVRYLTINPREDDVEFRICEGVKRCLEIISSDSSLDGRILILSLAKHSKLWLLKLFSEIAPLSDVIHQVLGDEEKHLNILSDIFVRYFRRGDGGSYVKYVQDRVYPLRFLAATDEDILEFLAPFVGGGFDEDHIDLGRQKITFTHEEMYSNRVNYLRRLGFDLITSQKIAESIGGAVKAGWGC